MPSAYQVQGRTQYSWTDTAALDNLVLNNNVPKPTSIPEGHALIRIRAAALNARDNMVIAHDPLYPGPHIEDVVPCADGAGEIEAIGESSRFKVGDKVIINPNAWQDWNYDGSKGEMMGYVECRTLGAGQTNGTLTEYAVIVCCSYLSTKLERSKC
jgi:NADPH:quinone reductase-like Zn-dependent oxidoreductase